MIKETKSLESLARVIVDTKESIKSYPRAARRALKPLLRKIRQGKREYFQALADKKQEDKRTKKLEEQQIWLERKLKRVQARKEKYAR